MPEQNPAEDTNVLSSDIKGNSTASSGPAGAHFEGQVAAFYLLAMLSDAPPRGLPGTTINRVALQQANTGHPLDDVIVHATDVSGKSATLEIQVKLTITFAPSDPVFRKVVGQIVETSKQPGFLENRTEMAIAISRGSEKINGPYQEVIERARQIGDSDSFFIQLNLPGAANSDMRAFVKTFRDHLKNEGSPHDDTATWQLLRRLQILVFDFTAPGSAHEYFARKQAQHTLHADDAGRADALWDCLIESAIHMATSGGDRTRSTLLESLTPSGFRFAGDRRNIKARAALAESSRHALNDIQNQVGRAVLTRHERVTAVYKALDHGRYVEIRGDAGVGKSGVLRQIAESLQTEGQVIVLSPGRCVPRGWSAMRAQLAFEDSLRELLLELAFSGGAIVFLDNLDSFSDEERSTVKDIVREASQVPGISVIATARSDFGVDDPSWLPRDALDSLGQSEPVLIDELSKDEIKQLTTIDPALAPLLRNNHPARKVTSNLFRLARLADRPRTDSLPPTEIEMAQQWWDTADGGDDGRRERCRLLKDLAQQALSSHDLDVKEHASKPIDDLIASGTLRDSRNDHVAFRHDVLRDWAIANVLYADNGLINGLNLDRPVPTTLARGVELAARMAIELATDEKAWHKLLDRLSGKTAHKSWSRMALLALVRSEMAETLLQRAQSVLFDDHASLFRELIRTVMAVNVVPLSKMLADNGIEPTHIPAGLANINMPRGSSWHELILWTLSIGNTLPNEAIPEVVKLYCDFLMAFIGLNKPNAIRPMAEPITRQLYTWLSLMELQDPSPKSRGFPVFWERLGTEQIQSLRDNLHLGFVAFAHTAPELAAEYLQAVGRNRNQDLMRSILKERGSLAQAAPAELAKLTEQALIATSQPRNRDPHDGPFTYLDLELFFPASPARGPFFELLENSPKDGLALVRQFVSHAVAHWSQGHDAATNAINLVFPDGERNFPWKQTYTWSRHSRYHVVTSALMALEAWAHRRIDAGDAFETVLMDVLGPTGSCAAYLLVAVDLIISHWPKSAVSTVAFLGCPELLCLDLQRQARDRASDFLGALSDEPRGTVSTAELKKRISRHHPLHKLIGHYALADAPDQRDKLTSLLRQAACRLEPASAQATLDDPEFMTKHALNLADPSNWHQVDDPQKDGTTASAYQYVPPAEEQCHLQPLKDAAAKQSDDLVMQTEIHCALENPSHFSSEQRRAAVGWARHLAPDAAETTDNDGNGHRIRQEAVLSVAMVTMRDGDNSLLAEHTDWAHAQFKNALASSNDDPVFYARTGLSGNPIAIAYAGLIHALQHRNTPDDVRAVLEVAAKGHYAAAHAIGAAATALETINKKLLPALLRCALRSCIVSNRYLSDENEEIPSGEEIATCPVQHKTTVDAEMEWMEGTGPEPRWPSFPKKIVRPTECIEDEMASETEEPPAQEHVFAHQRASLWLRQVKKLGDANKHPWLRDIVTEYLPWVVETNISNLGNGKEVDRPTSEWNAVFFELAARCIVGKNADHFADMVVAPITKLPEKDFFDVLVPFLYSVDVVYFTGGDMQAPVAVKIRSMLADRMLTSLGWKYLTDRSNPLSIEVRIAPAIATLFFNNHHFARYPSCYLHEKGVKRIGPFLPVLGQLVRSGPSLFVARVLLNLLEVSPHAEHLDLLVQAGKVWLGNYPDFQIFWDELGIGKRWCQIVEKIHAQDPAAIGPDTAVRAGIEGILAALVALGVPEANRLEESLR